MNLLYRLRLSEETISVFVGSSEEFQFIHFSVIYFIAHCSFIQFCIAVNYMQSFPRNKLSIVRLIYTFAVKVYLRWFEKQFTIVINMNQTLYSTLINYEFWKLP
jgi:hypothetical protein